MVLFCKKLIAHCGCSVSELNKPNRNKRQRGASMVEFIIVTPLLMFVGLGIMQFGVVYHAKSILNYATFEAARAGAVNNGQIDVMRKEFGYRMAPVFGGGGTIKDGVSAVVRSVVIANDPTATKIEILNPAPASFSLHGGQKSVVDTHGTSREVTAIPNSHLRHRSSEIKEDGLHVRDANLLKIQVTYGFQMRLPFLDMEVPGMRWAMRNFMIQSDPDNWMYYMRGMLPLKSTAMVRMQSEAWEQQLPTLPEKAFDSMQDWLIEEITNPPGSTDGLTTEGSSTEGGTTEGSSTEGGTTEGTTAGTTGGDTSGQTSGSTSGETEVVCESSWEDDRYNADEGGDWWNPLDWGDDIKAAAAIIWDFMSGVLHGLGDQVTDLWNLLKDPSVMWDLAKAFIDEPKKVIEELVKDLGTQVQTVLECGPKDIGKIIGQNINPAVMVKLVGRLGRLSDNNKLTKYADEYDGTIKCASFPAGELVWTPSGQVNIESIRTGDLVNARSYQDYTNSPQIVETTFGRVAPGFYRIQTDLGSVEATAEHPFWIQGTGWVEAQNIQPMDAIATIDGDVVATENVYVDRKTEVYNFSVANTRTYFAGAMGAWVHNALPCRLRYALASADFPNLTLKKIDPNELFAGVGNTAGGYRNALKDAYKPHLDDAVLTQRHQKWQQHHVIPKDVFNNTPWLKDLGFDIDSIHNAMPLRKYDDVPGHPAKGSIHRGQHPKYSEAVTDFLKKIEDAEFNGKKLDDATKREMVVSGIETIRKSLNSGNPPLRNADMPVVTKAQWEAVLKKVYDDEIALLAQGS